MTGLNLIKHTLLPSFFPPHILHPEENLSGDFSNLCGDFLKTQENLDKNGAKPKKISNKWHKDP